MKVNFQLYKTISVIEFFGFLLLISISDNLYIEICFVIAAINAFIMCLIWAYRDLCAISESKTEINKE